MCASECSMCMAERERKSVHVRVCGTLCVPVHVAWEEINPKGLLYILMFVLCLTLCYL